MKDKLTAKQQAFVNSYADPGSKTYNNAYQSAVKAGYAEATAVQAGRAIAENCRVNKAIDDKWAEIAEKMDVTRGEVVKNARWLIKHGQDNGKGQDVAAGNLQLGKIIAAYTDNLQQSGLSVNVREAKRDGKQIKTDKAYPRLKQIGN